MGVENKTCQGSVVGVRRMDGVAGVGWVLVVWSLEWTVLLLVNEICIYMTRKDTDQPVNFR